MEPKIILNTTRFSVSEQEYILNTGTKKTKYIVHHPGAVVVIPKISSDKFILIKQERKAINKVIIEFPAGCIDPGEDPLVCADRELQEEIGFKAAELIPIGISYPAPGFCDEKQFFYIGKNLLPSKLPADEGEEIEMFEATANEIDTMIQDGSIIDGKTIAIWMKYKLLK